MGGDIISKAKWFINSTTLGNKQLPRVESWDESDDSSVEVVNDLEGPTGHREVPGGGSLSISQYRETVPFGWLKLKNASELFSLTRQDTGGERVQYLGCRVSTMSAEGGSDGGNMQTVEIVWTSRKVL